MDTPTHSLDSTNGVASLRPHVVVVGAGFAGLEAVRMLSDAPVQVTLIDRNNYHKFQPLLYQVATAGLEADDIAHTVREIVRSYDNVRFRLGTVRSVDAEARRLEMEKGAPIAYDYLILAAGAVTNYFDVEGAEAHAFPLKNIPDALDLRNRVLRQFEQYYRAPHKAPEGALNFVLVGGGPTGVEMAGALTELFTRVLQKDFPDFDTRKATVYLLEREDRLLGTYAPSLSQYTREVLERRGVQVRLGTAVAKVEEDAVVLDTGERIPTQTLIWSAGIKASPVANSLGTKQAGGGRLVVNEDLSLPGHPEVFAAGDLSGATDQEGTPYPQQAQVAIQQGRHAARQVLRLARGAATEPFQYLDPGQMATIGRNAAVAELAGGIKLKGFIAWAMWAFVHILKLVGFRNRASVFINWVYNYFTYDRSARLILDVVPLSDGLPLEPEDVAETIKKRLDMLKN